MTDIKKTKPLPRFSEWKWVQASDPAWRYWTEDMAKIWGPENTINLSLEIQWKSAQVLAKLYPNIVSKKDADEIYKVATSGNVSIDRIKEIESKIHHDVIAINTALWEQVSQWAQAHINKAKTSADTTQPARALQFKQSLEVIIKSVENLRDIMCEKAIEWKEIPFMDTTHLYDALPTTAGRPFAHYIEMLESDLQFIKYVYNNSIKWKWWDATWNHHSATALWIDGIKLQKELCDEIWVWYMDASAQIPWLEFEMDIQYVMARLTETMNNIAKFIALWRSDDVNIFINWNPKKHKWSSAMPHKDAKNGNPIVEEQTMSLRNYMLWNLVTAGMNCEMPYARNLAASANARINFEDGFKFLDHGIRRLAETVYWLKLNKERSIERVQRSFGVVTSQQVMTYLTDQNRTNNPMSREKAHDLMWELAQKAWDTKTPFVEIVLQNEEVTSRLDEKTIREITDPLKYIWKSIEIIETVINKYYKKKTI